MKKCPACKGDGVMRQAKDGTQYRSGWFNSFLIFGKKDPIVTCDECGGKGEVPG